MKKFAVILAGCGVFDGAEIHEATLSLYAIAKQGAAYEIFAPNIEQHHVINHLTGEEMPEKRNVLVESARIARGAIKDLSELNVADFDALLFPGGFGVAKNLCTLAFQGADAVVDPQIEEVVLAFHKAEKPIAALCIAPAMIAKIIQGAAVTIGQDKGTIQAIEAMGGNHETTTHGEVIIDEKNKVYSTPCYMLEASILDIADGAENIVAAVLQDLK